MSASPEALVALGPLVEVIVCKPIPGVRDLSGVEQETIKLMVDTGAHKTVVDRAVAERLGVTPIRFEAMVGVSHVPEDCPVYLMTLVLGVSDGVRDSFVTFTAEMIGMSTPPSPRPFQGLLGRDCLRFMRIVYDGPGGCVDLHDGMIAGAGQARPGPKAPSKSATRRLQKDARKKNRRR